MTRRATNRITQHTMSDFLGDATSNLSICDFEDGTRIFSLEYGDAKVQYRTMSDDDLRLIRHTINQHLDAIAKTNSAKALKAERAARKAQKAADAAIDRYDEAPMSTPAETFAARDQLDADLAAIDSRVATAPVQRFYPAIIGKGPLERPIDPATEFGDAFLTEA